MVFNGGAAIEMNLTSYQLQIAERRLNLSRSQQLGHSATYNTPFHYLSRLQRIYPLKQWIVVIHRTVGSDWLTSRFRTGLYDTVVALAGYEYSQLRWSEGTKSRHFPAWILT